MPVVGDFSNPEDHSVICFDGIEVVDHCRTLAYVAKLHPSYWPGLACPTCDLDQYVSPQVDDAPWYDPMIPASADVLGVWINKRVISSPYKRNKRDRLYGSSVGSARYIGRDVVLEGVVFTKSVEGTDYARQWLHEVFQGRCDAGACSKPTMSLETYPDAEGKRQRTFYDCAVTDFAWDEDLDDFPKCWGGQFDLTITSEQPFMFHDPKTVYLGPVVPEGATATCNICNPCPPMPDEDPLQCGCVDTPTRIVPQPDADDCWCNPIDIFRITAETEAPAYWAEARAIIRVTAGFDVPPGRPGISNLRIRAWANPVGYPPPLPSDGLGLNCVEPCMEVDVACIPAGATLVIDAARRRAVLEGAGQTVSAYPYLSSDSGGSKFDWPEVSCHGLMIAVDSDAFAGNTAPDSVLEIELVGVDRG